MATNSFDAVIARMPLLLEQLESCPPLTKTTLKGLPARGIYAFYEGERPIYVGRTNSMRSRLLQHSRPSSMHNSATFAFLLAVEDFMRDKVAALRPQRGILQKDPAFSDVFRLTKERVSNMSIRFVAVDSAVEQTIFEVYAALALATPYNSFENH